MIRQTLLQFAYNRVARGEPMPGVISTNDNQQPVGSAIDNILFIAECMREEEIEK